VPGKNNTVAIELICTHIRRQLERRSRHFRQDMVGSLSLEPSLSRGPAREPSTEELGLTVLEQTPQLKVVVFHLGRSDVAVFMFVAEYLHDPARSNIIPTRFHLLH
jgi:hypothetical protein